MNKLERQRRINDNSRFFQWNSKSGSHINCFKFNANNSDEHEDGKYKIYKRLRREGKSVLVEGILENGRGTPDVTDLDDGLHYEVAHKETEESLKKKIEKYPLPVEVIRVE